MLLTTKEMAKSLKVTTATVYRMMKDGRIPQEYYTKIGNDWRFNGEGIERHLLSVICVPPTNP